MRRALKNWLETSPRTKTSPPESPLASMVTGGQPVPRSDVARDRRPLRATSRSDTGRSRIRGVPSRWKVPTPVASIAVRKRRLVPEFARYREADRDGMFAAQPWIVMAAESMSCTTSMPSARSAVIITCVSSQSRAPRRMVPPLAMAATTRARFVRLFDPGTRATASRGGVFQGSIVISAGYSAVDMRSGLVAEDRGSVNPGRGRVVSRADRHGDPAGATSRQRSCHRSRIAFFGTSRRKGG